MSLKKNRPSSPEQNAPASCCFGIQRHLDNVSAIILLINNQLNLSKHSSPSQVSSSHGILAKCLSTLLAVIRAKGNRGGHFGQCVQPKASCCLRLQVLGLLQSKSELHAVSSLQKIYHKRVSNKGLAKTRLSYRNLNGAASFSSQREFLSPVPCIASSQAPLCPVESHLAFIPYRIFGQTDISSVGVTQL